MRAHGPSTKRTYVTATAHRVVTADLAIALRRYLDPSKDGFTQLELALRAGVSPRKIFGILRAEHATTLHSTADRLLTAVGAPYLLHTGEIRDAVVASKRRTASERQA